MNLTRFFRSILLTSVAVLSLQADDVTISQIYVSIGPNANAPSPSYGGYTTNAQAGVQAGGVNQGGSITNTPTAYNVVGNGNTATVANSSIIETSDVNGGPGFSSWLGTADPGGAFAGETGNMIFFSVVITGTNISLSGLNITQSSTDPLSSFGSPSNPFTFNFGSTSYSADQVGITAGNTLVTSGLATQQVNEIILTSVGVSLDPGVLQQDFPGLTFTGTDAQQEQEIIAAFDQDLGNFEINTCYTYTGSTASSCDTVNVLVPEPSVNAGILLGLATLLPLASRLRRKVS